MTPKEIYLDSVLAAWIKEHGYDGLYSDECGCLADDLCPCSCGSNLSDCRLGYNYGPRETDDGHAEFWVGPMSPAERAHDGGNVGQGENALIDHLTDSQKRAIESCAIPAQYLGVKPAKKEVGE